MDYRVWITQEALEATDKDGVKLLPDERLIVGGICFSPSPMHVPAERMTDEIRADARLHIEEWTDRPSEAAEAADGYPTKEART